jgi:hypothetical protein
MGDDGMGSSTLFRKSSLDSISSPDQLNDYIKVSNPSIWLALAALFLLLASVLVWGFTGRLEASVRSEGVVINGSVLCYVGTDDAKKVSIGQKAALLASGGLKLKGQVSGVGNIPLSAEEITGKLGSDYLTRNFTQGEFAVEIAIKPDNADLQGGTLLNIDIVTDEVRPANFLVR